MKEYINEDGTPFSKEQFIDKIKNDKEFSNKFGYLGPIYGKQWRSWSKPDLQLGKQILLGQIDQIANLIRDLKTNPDSRRLMVNSWNCSDLDSMVLPPCHYGFQVYTRELSLEERTQYKKKRDGISRTFAPYTHQMLDDSNIPTRAISLMFNMRSNDVPLGLPFNIASYGLLLEIIGKMVNMVPDELIANLGDAHIYKNQIDGVKEQLSRESYPLPTLNINTEFWPTENGSCDEGPLDVIAVLKSFNDDNFCKCLLEEDIQLCNYKSGDKIHFPLSN